MAVCDALGLARSHVHMRLHGPSDWHDAWNNRTPAPGEEVLGELQQYIANLAIYGYPRACALGAQA